MPPTATRSDPDGLLAKVAQTIDDHDMLAPGDRILVGVSGGPDSMVLLHVLARLANRLMVTLGVAHLHHGLRGEAADKDVDAVRAAAASMACPCHVIHARVINVKQGLGLSLEEAGRRVRYAFFRKIMHDAGYTKLALGHHMDDNAEQMLLVLLRGTGPLGLAGIAPVRDNRIIRPMIDVRRSQVIRYLEHHTITRRDDATNTDQRFLRNRVRHQLMPLLASRYNPRVSGHLHRLAALMRAEAAWIDELVEASYRHVVARRTTTSIVLCTDRLNDRHTALARRLIRRALGELAGGLRRIGFTHVQAVLTMVAHPGAEKEIHLPGGIRARRCSNRLTLSIAAGNRRRPPVARKHPSRFAVVIDGPFPTRVNVQAMGVGLQFSLHTPMQLPRWADVGPTRAYVDLDRVMMPLVLRSAVPGDRFTPLGSDGSQKLKKYFIDHRVSRNRRAATPVLADARRIVWLVGQRIDDAVKLTRQTTRVLGIEYFLLDTR